MKKIWPRKNIWMTALPVVLVNTVVRGYWVLLLSWPNGPMCTCATAHDLRSLTSIAWISPGTVLNHLSIECIYFFLSQVRKFWTPHLLFLYVSIFLIDFSSFWTSAIIIFKIAWHVVIWRKISRFFFSNLFILIVVMYWENLKKSYFKKVNEEIISLLHKMLRLLILRYFVYIGVWQEFLFLNDFV